MRLAQDGSGSRFLVEGAAASLGAEIQGMPIGKLFHFVQGEAVKVGHEDPVAESRGVG